MLFILLFFFLSLARDTFAFTHSLIQLIILINPIQMKNSNFKNMLARIKQDFNQKMAATKCSALPTEEVAQLLHKYLNGEPLMLKQMLFRSAAKEKLSWDDLLQYLEEQLSIIQTVKKVQYSSISSTEIIEKHTNDFSKLLQYLKSKQTNSIQNMHNLSLQVGSKNTIVICFEKQLIFYDCTHNQILNKLGFKYTNTRQKLLDKQQQKKMHKIQRQQQKLLQMQDQVDEITNVNLILNKNNNPQKINKFLTNNIKNSVRGSQLSSQNSNEKMVAFRKLNTESLDKKKMKSSVTRIKNDDVNKIFHLFQNSSLENSIHIARAFVDARANFQKNIVLQNSFLQKQGRQRNFQLSSVKFQKNYERQLIKMRRTSKQLTNYRTDFSLDAKNRSLNIKMISRRSSFQDGSIKQKKSIAIDPLQMGSKQLQIITASLYENFIVVSLFNREVRLFKLKRSLNRISQEPIFQKSFKQVITFAQIYKSHNKGTYSLFVALQKEGFTQVKIYHLNEQMQIKSKAFEKDLAYSAKCQSVIPLGVVLYNQLGFFSIIELNNSQSLTEQKLAISTQLFNPETGSRISITQVLIDSKLSSFFISCSSGFIYLYDWYLKSIKYKNRTCQSPVLDICLVHNDQQLLVLYGNGNMAIVSTFHLETVYIYQSYGEISSQSKIFKGNDSNFYVYTTRAIIPYCLIENDEKQFNHSKALKVFKNRLKLKTKQKGEINKSRVVKVIEGKGGQQDCICIILEKGEIIIMNKDLQYVGSYYYFRVMHIVNIFLNQSHQFMAIVLDNNQIQVINIYTQSLLFSLKTTDTQNTTSRPDSSLRSTELGNKNQRISKRQNILLIAFMTSQTADYFMAILSKSGKVVHINEKGSTVEGCNLHDKISDKISGLALYVDQELVISSECNLIIFHRKSYNRKGVIKPSQYNIIGMKKCYKSQNCICTIDDECNVFVIDIVRKETRITIEGNSIEKMQRILFNQLMLICICSQRGLICIYDQKQYNEKQIDIEKYQCLLLGSEIIKINKNTCKLSKYIKAIQGFEGFLI